jgi:hypothetical protein
LINWIRSLYISVFRNAAAFPDSNVILHDPASQRPRDLDDPFFSQEAQARIGEAIAKSVEPK